MKPALMISARPRHEVVDRQRVERGQVAQHARGRVEGADEVLALGGVDAGLAADRRVHHAQHGGRHGDPAHPAQPGRGHEPGEVRGGPAADTDDEVAAGEAGLTEGLPAVRGDLGGLGLLGVGHLDGHDLEALAGQVLAQRFAGLGERLRVDDRDALGALADQAGQLTEELTSDEHLVRLGAGRAADLDAGGRLPRMSVMLPSTPVRRGPPGRPLRGCGHRWRRRRGRLRRTSGGGLPSVHATACAG